MKKQKLKKESQKYVCAFMTFHASGPCLDAVRYDSGKKEGQPYLYDSEDEVKQDRYFDPANDQVLTAEEFFSRVRKSKAA